MELFKLMGSIFVDNKAANSSLQQTERLGGKVAGSLGKVVSAAGKMALGFTAMASAGAGALLSVANKSSETADRVDKMSLKLNLSRQGFQEWDHVMKQSGMQIESLQGGMKKLVNSIDEAVNGNASAVESFQRVGISVEDLKGKSPEQVFEMLVKKLQEMPPSAEKAALANELLGKSAAEMAPILNVSSEEVEKLKQEARDLGLVMGDDAVDAGVKFGDTMANVKEAFGMVITKIGVSVMPMIQKFLDWVLANMPQIQSAFSSAFSTIGSIVEGAVNVFQTYFLPILQELFDFISTNGPIIGEVLGGAFETLSEILSPIVDFIGSIIEYLTNFNDTTNLTLPILTGLVAGFVAFKAAIMISSIISAVSGAMTAFTAITQGQTIAQAALNAVMALNPFALIAIAIGAVVAVGVLLYRNWETISTKAQELWQTLGTVWDNIKSKVSETWEGIKTSISNAWNSIKSVVSNAVENVKSAISNGFNAAKSVVSSVWEGIKTAIKTPIESAIGIVKGAIDKIKNLFNFKFQWPHIPLPHFSISGSANPLNWLKEGVPSINVEWYAKGGIFDKPTIFSTASGFKGVGEAGPEAVAPISKLTDYVKEAVRNENREMLVVLYRILDALEKNNSELYRVLLSGLEKLKFSVDDREFMRLVRESV